MDTKEYIGKLIENIPVAMVIADKDGFIKYVNDKLLNIFGYKASEILGSQIDNLFEGYGSLINLIQSKENIVNKEVYVHARKNKLRLTLGAYPIFNSNKDIEEILYIFEDIKNERKLAQKIKENRAIYTFDKILSKNKDFNRLIEFAKKVADSKSTILITGETGTGKEVFAGSIHNYSNRRKEPFIAINSAAIPKTLIESELFGYEEGAFTGAKKSGQVGKFELAHKGTIFLDEIGEMPLELQTRLLRVIEEGIVSRIGGTEPIVVDVRIIAASNKNLREEVEKGNFRKDLFYRLNVLPINILPLRHRQEDIPLLAEYFMEKLSKRLNKRMVPMTEEEINKLMEYSWPGNVRELENFIELTINLEYVPVHILFREETYNTIATEHTIKNISLEAMEKNHILEVLKINNGNITGAAKVLGIGRNTLYRKIDKYKINCSIMGQNTKTEQ